MQEQMQQLQQQLEASQKVPNPSSVSAQTPENSTGARPVIPKQSGAQPAAASRKMETQAGEHRGLPPPVWSSVRALCVKKKSVFFSATSSRPSIRESSGFVDELNTANSFKHKARVAHQPKPSAPGNFLHCIDLFEIVMFSGNILWHVRLRLECISITLFLPGRQRPAGGDKGRQLLPAV